MAKKKKESEVKKDIDIRVGQSVRGNTYVAVHYHQFNAISNKHKSRWAKDMNPKAQFTLFCLADIKPDSERWMSNGSLFGFKNGAKDVIGCNDEVLCQFRGDDKLKEWHGYPVKKINIDTYLVNRWREKRLITASKKKDIICKLI